MVAVFGSLTCHSYHNHQSCNWRLAIFFCFWMCDSTREWNMTIVSAVALFDNQPFYLHISRPLAQVPIPFRGLMRCRWSSINNAPKLRLLCIEKTIYYSLPSWYNILCNHHCHACSSFSGGLMPTARYLSGGLSTGLWFITYQDFNVTCINKKTHVNLTWYLYPFFWMDFVWV